MTFIMDQRVSSFVLLLDKMLCELQRTTGRPGLDTTRKDSLRFGSDRLPRAIDGRDPADNWPLQRPSLLLASLSPQNILFGRLLTTISRLRKEKAQKSDLTAWELGGMSTGRRVQEDASKPANEITYSGLWFTGTTSAVARSS
ncbi:uncharacterized protein LACBIDRAFT_328655 [Laccaria bicolor S238N-H82]|uniref:Predicted protein n=1 Tax=Laccaria bicolor (strain S238N-H82 / ATCC MYA-4686) TaxID=486041 RepID=B0DFK6_LACBS|nr:uncharacterized protein LACBIDRAFT_328655 [Laccaria bicolor S238N-H82]EDR06720.1 predicted protein [Laccaria bicolor S238N-H82]|eukprot:XP_001882567.1 predicted protein [Laccaria bicolor S238N-H82]